MHLLHTGPIGLDPVRQPVQTPFDRCQIAREVSEVRSAAGSHEAGRQQSVQLGPNVVDRVGLSGRRLRR